MYRDPAKDETAEFVRKGKDSVWADLEKRYGPRIMTPVRKARWMANDFEALSAISWRMARSISLEDVLPTITLPCLLFIGEADAFHLGVKKCATCMPNATSSPFQISYTWKPSIEVTLSYPALRNSWQQYIKPSVHAHTRER